MHAFLYDNTKNMGGIHMKISNKEAEQLVHAIIKTAQNNGLKIRRKAQKKKTSNLSS